LQGKCVNAMEGHTRAVKSVAWINLSQFEGSFLSASQDQTVQMWKFSPQNGKSKCIHVCRGHAGSVDCLAVDPSMSKFASGSWDKLIKIWDAAMTEGVTDDENISSKKKRNENDTDAKATSRIPLVTLLGHKEPVSSLIWHDSDELISAGWDHCIRLWDIETATNKHTLTGNKVILNIVYSTNNGLLASGSCDKNIRLWDLRKSDGAVVKTTLSSHEGWVSSVQWSPVNENHLCSGSYDENIKLWDIRKTSSALFDLEKHDDKVMSLCWKKNDIILSGGADCKVHLYRDKKISPVSSEE